MALRVSVAIVEFGAGGHEVRRVGLPAVHGRPATQRRDVGFQGGSRIGLSSAAGCSSAAASVQGR